MVQAGVSLTNIHVTKIYHIIIYRLSCRLSEFYCAFHIQIKHTCLWDFIDQIINCFIFVAPFNILNLVSKYCFDLTEKYHFYVKLTIHIRKYQP